MQHHTRPGANRGTRTATLENVLRGAFDDATITVTISSESASPGPSPGPPSGLPLATLPAGPAPFAFRWPPGEAGADAAQEWVAVHRASRPFDDAERGLIAALATAVDVPAVTADRQFPSRLDPAVVADVVEQVLSLLDHAMRAPMHERLGVVAECFSTRLGAVGWWVGSDQDGQLGRRVDSENPLINSKSPTGGPTSRARSTVSSPLEPTDRQLRRVLEGGSLAAWAGDSTWLWGRGATTVVAAGGYDPDARRWAVVLHGDATAPDLRDAQAGLLGAVQAALGFPRIPQPYR